MMAAAALKATAVERCAILIAPDVAVLPLALGAWVAL